MISRKTKSGKQKTTTKGNPGNWTSGGPEDQDVLKKIKEGKITKYTKAADLKKLDMYKNFSNNVIRNHLNALKKSNGLTCKH